LRPEGDVRRLDQRNQAAIVGRGGDQALLVRDPIRHFIAAAGTVLRVLGRVGALCLRQPVRDLGFGSACFMRP
jgi:hypothetical protein